MDMYRCFGNQPICDFAYQIADPAGGHDTGCDRCKIGTLFCTGICDEYSPSQRIYNPSARSK